MERHFYGWTWAYGVATDGDSGAPIGRLHRFNSKQERDTWTSGGADFRSSPGFREACPYWWTRYDREPVEHAGEA